MMHKEKLTNDSNRILVFIFTVVGVLFVLSLYQFVKIERYGFIADILLIAVLSAVAFLLLKYFLTDYTYTVVGREIIFNKNNGRSERGIIDVPFDHIEAILPADSCELEQYKGIKKVNRYVLNNIKRRKYCIIYRTGTAMEKIVFQPSDDLLRILKKGMEGKVQ